MDTHVTAHLPVEEDSPAPSARVAGETDAPILEGGFREGNPEPGVRLPGEAEEPPLGEGFAEFRGPRAPTRRRLPTAPQPWWKRRQILLLGVAVIALGAAGGAPFSFRPTTTSTRFRKWPRRCGIGPLEMGIARTAPLAPAASLAGVPTAAGRRR